MPWPKGKPRKGHINKDGTAHAAHGQKIAKVVEVRPVVAPERAARRLRVERAVTIAQPKTSVKIHGESSRPVIEPCPQCNYAYADGGYCPECGWSLPTPRRK